MTQYPKRSKVLRALRKVYPGAELKTRADGSVTLTYLIGGERVEVLTAARGVKEGFAPPAPDAMNFAVLKLAFRTLGYDTKFVGSGLGFEFAPIKGFVKQEDDLPIELDPDISPDEVARLLNEQVKARETELGKGHTLLAVPMPAGMQATPSTSTELAIPITPEDVPK